MGNYCCFSTDDVYSPEPIMKKLLDNSNEFDITEDRPISSRPIPIIGSNTRIVGYSASY